MINTIFFDIGGVLLNIHPERTIKQLSTLTNLTEKEIVNAFPEDAHHKYERGEITDLEFYNEVKYNLPVSNNLTEEQFWNTWSLLVGEETEVVKIMNSLTTKYPVWLLSNTNPYHILEEERFKLFDKITGGIYSFEVGSRKPEEDIYLKALEIAGTIAEKSLFIDDLIENVEKARYLNMNAIHYKSIDDLHEKLDNFLIV
ncbi:MAG: HAD family phosphatase [Candidatus Marinimicrobia bacterium]|nr:HAD family phosphatase [Candidatus Neomarinimicrobiota bacterium]